MTIPKKKIEQLKKHATRNAHKVFDKLGMSHYDRGDGLIQSVCPCKQHPGDRNNATAFSWRTDIGKWVCWTHHCEESRGNDILGLVSSVLGTNFADTVKWIESVMNDENVDLAADVAMPETRRDQVFVHEPLNEDNLKFLQPKPRYLIDRGFDSGVLQKYQVGLWHRPATFMHDRVIFPVRDDEGHLVGYTGRTIHSESYFEKKGLAYNKWVHGRHFNRWPKRGELSTGSILFNLHKAKNWIEPHRRIILVEGPLDGMRLEEAGIRNWVATLSTNFSAAHRTLLVKYGIRHLYVAYDQDDPANYKNNIAPIDKALEKMRRIVGDLFEINVVKLPFGKDCGDLTVEEAQQIFEDIK